MKIILNDELSIFDQLSPEKKLEGLADKKQKLLSNLKWTYVAERQRNQKHDVVYSTLSSEADTYHLGFLGAASLAYSRHHGLEFSPDVIWHTILCEISNLIKLSPEVCKPLFVKDPQIVKKQQIVVYTSDPTKINLFDIVDQLSELTPIDTDLFLPEFSTSTKETKLAHAAALCESASQYYEYCTMMCGIRHIELLGTKADWELACSKLIKIAGEFKRIQYPEAVEYLVKVIDTLILILDSFNPERQAYNKDFWLDIYTQKNVGSGTDLNISGWIKDLFYDGTGKNARGSRLESFLTSVSIVPYKNLETGRKFKSTHGCFSSVLKNGTLIPGFDYVVFEKV